MTHDLVRRGNHVDMEVLRKSEVVISDTALRRYDIGVYCYIIPLFP